MFIATSIKVDIVDSFEKRIKSRFSHRMVRNYEIKVIQVLFYEQKLETLKLQLACIFTNMIE